MPGPIWGWDVTARRYRSIGTGRFMARQAVLGYVDQAVEGTRVVTDKLAGFVYDGSVSPKDFGELLRKELKSVYLQEYLLGRGGRGRMTQADYGRVGGILREQYKWIPGFVKDLESGQYSEEYIASRAGMYVRSARESWGRAHEVNAKEMEMDQEHWNLGATEHCPSCLEFAGMDWQPVGTFPMPGDGTSTECKTNCACNKSYRNEGTRAQY